MKKAFRKNLWREIGKTKSRFLSLLAITAIGVAMFTGVKAATPTMLKSVNAYYQQQNVSDVQIINFQGMKQAAIAQIYQLFDDVHVEPGYLFDSYVIHQEKEIIARGLTYQEMNQPRLIKGRLLENDRECLISNDYEELLNETVTLENSFKKERCRVVGIVESPLHFAKMYKGANRLGAGQTQAILYVSTSEAASFAFPSRFIASSDQPSYNVLNLSFDDLKPDHLYDAQFKETLIDKQAVLKEALPSEEEIHLILDNESVKAFKEDALNIQNIAVVFPIVFFIVAALVGLTTMTRMIDEKRLQLGIFKALGYSRRTILLYYCLYALFASMLGVIIGLILGYTIIPPAVLSAYRRIYLIPKMVLDINFWIGLLASLLAIAIILGATILSALSSLRLYPAELLRPKSPPAGKRIVLERITWLWKRLNFTNKVTARNLLRYKKRFFMSVFGIMGCTSLLITALGIQTSVKPIRDRQFNDIYRYQLTVYTDEIADINQNPQQQALSEINHVIETLAIKDITIDYDVKNSQQLVHLIVPEDNERFDQFIHLKQGQATLSLNDHPVIMTEKLAELLKLKVGDYFTYKTGTREYSLKIYALTDFYIGHSLFIDQTYFKQITGDSTLNAFFLKTDTKDPIAIDQVISDIGKLPFVKLVVSSIDANQMVKDSIGGIDYIVWVMIGFAGTLALVVMYNLTTINIAERNRELATIKVLGFYNIEVATYVYKENIVLTLIGIVAGILVGIPLHRYIIQMAEPNTIYFLRHLTWSNYLLAFVITLAFSMIINLIMYSHLVKINMVESLKSVE